VNDPRARLYAWLGDLLQEPDAVAAAEARALPALAPAFPEDLDADALAASHHRALGLEVLPYVPVFLAPDGLLRDPVRDHVGAVLHDVAAGRAGALDAVLRVLPPLVLALRDVDPGWALVAELALELAVSEPRPPTAWTPSGALPDLEAQQTGLRDLAEALVRPAVSGWFPTLRAIGRVAVAANVPSGFGGRADRLQAALLAAIDAGRAPALVDAVAAELSAWDAGLASLAEVGAPVDPWRVRIRETSTWVARIRGGALPSGAC
jgi:hypothetical protein